jgi:hypothetical protein
MGGQPCHALRHAAMTLIACWLFFPALLVLVALGCGLLAERLSGIRLPGPLLPPLGVAVIVVVAQLITYSSSTASLAPAVVVVLAVLGLAMGRVRERRPDPFVLGAAAAVFVAFAAPTVLSGEATFAGYIKLDDTASWLALTDHVMAHGRDLSGLQPSSYQATLDFYLGNGYPVGALLPLGVVAPLAGQDLAWVFAPYLATLAAMLCLGLNALLAPLVRARRLRALGAFVASQSALLFGYSQWGGVKELATALLLAVLAGLVPVAIADPRRARSLVPLAVCSASVLAVLNLGGAAWVVPPLAFVLVALVRRQRRLGDQGFRAKQVLAFSALAALLALPSLATASAFRNGNSILTDPSDLQNLLRPLRWLQLAGVWPSEDFRSPPSAVGVTYLLVLLVFAAAVTGLVWAHRRGASGLVVYVLAALAGWAAVAYFGSPWVDAKALTTASPALPLAAMAGVAAVAESGHRVGALVLGALIAGGVLWSNALAYHDVSLAPRDRLAELEQIGERIAGQGPTLMTDYEPYGDRHFLRKADPEGASDLRRRPVLLRSGRDLPKGQSADIDRFQLDAVLIYRTLVLRRSPAESRPPAPYRLVRRGRYYEVWQRSAAIRPAVLSHTPLGDRFQAGAAPPCSTLRRVAGEARSSGAVLAAPSRARSLVAVPSRSPHPRGWVRDSTDPTVLYPKRSGSVQLELEVRRPGRYVLWLGGSFGRGFDVSLDGRPVAEARSALGNAGQYLRLAEHPLRRGRHRVVLRYRGGDLSPGSSDRLWSLGALLAAPAGHYGRLLEVNPGDADRLCGKVLDWVEVVRR